MATATQFPQFITTKKKMFEALQQAIDLYNLGELPESDLIELVQGWYNTSANLFMDAGEPSKSLIHNIGKRRAAVLSSILTK